MSLATELHDYLKRRKDLAALVTGNIFVASVPQGVNLPTVVLTQISLNSDHHMTAASGLYEAGYQIDGYANHVSLADEIAEQVRLSVDGLRTEEFDTVTLDAVQMDGDRMEVLDTRIGEDEQTHRRSIDITIWYRDVVPTFPAS
jgi:hypothetical protein